MYFQYLIILQQIDIVFKFVLKVFYIFQLFLSHKHYFSHQLTLSSTVLAVLIEILKTVWNLWTLSNFNNESIMEVDCMNGTQTETR